jgi:uncharacterized protein (TIGR03067 family)
MLLLAGGFCAGDDTKDGKKDDKDQFQGEWVVVSAEVSGKESAGIKDKKLVLKGDEWTPPSRGRLKFKFKLDAAKDPKQLDLMADVGGKEQTWSGIYKLDGDTFTFCRSAGPGGERPKEFKGGAGVFLMVCKRDSQGDGKRLEQEKQVAQLQIVVIETALKAYKVKYAKYPESLKKLTDGDEPIMLADGLVDPWGKPFKYDAAGPKNNKKKPDVWAEAPDKTLIGNWQDEKKKAK